MYDFKHLPPTLPSDGDRERRDPVALSPRLLELRARIRDDRYLDARKLDIAAGRLADGLAELWQADDAG